MKSEPDGHSYEFGQFRFEPETGRLISAGEMTSLPPKAAALLHFFLENQGRVFKKNELMDTIWRDEIVEEANLSQTIYLLRKAFKQTSSSEQFIETLPRIGYRFIASVQIVPVAQPPGEKAAALSPQTEKQSHRLRETHRAAIDLYELPSNGTLSSRTAKSEQLLAVLDNAAPASSQHEANQAHTFRETVWGFVFKRTNIQPKQALALPRASPRLSRKAKIAVVGIFLAVALGVAGFFVLRPARTIRLSSIAVLPFTELNNQTPDATLGLGVADTTISRLGGLGSIEVRPTSAIRRYTEQSADPLVAGRELKVESVLTGNIQRQNKTVRVTAQLLRVSDGKTLWSGTFDEQESQLFTLQDALTTQLVAALGLPLNEAERHRLQKRETRNLEAYQLYLKGRLFWNRRTPEWIQKGADCFNQAIQLDPDYALAYVGLADSYSLTSSEFSGKEAKARAAIQKALSLDNQLAEAHASLGFIKYKFDFDWAGAEVAFKRAIELNPNYATAFHWYGEMMARTGRFDEALKTMQQAERLDPLSLAIKEDTGTVWYFMRQYDQALKRYREVLEIDPQFARTIGQVAKVYEAQGRFDEAVKERLRALSFEKDTSAAEIDALKKAYEQDGWKGFWDYQRRRKEDKNRSAYSNARIYLHLGDKERALYYLSQSFADRSGIQLTIRDSPEWDPLRGDPRFKEMVRRSGF